MPSSFLRFLDHTQRRITVGTTPLDEWSARHRDLYLTTHNTHNRQTPIPPVGFEHTISASERPQTYALDRAANGTGAFYHANPLFMVGIFFYLRPPHTSTLFQELKCGEKQWLGLRLFSYANAVWHQTTSPSLTFWRRNYFFFNFSTSVYKMWVIQEPNTLELWNKLHFEEREKNEEYIPCLKYSVPIFVEQIYKMQRLEVSGAVRQL